MAKRLPQVLNVGKRLQGRVSSGHHGRYRLGTTADPGPEVEGYVDKYFKDYQPDGKEIQVEDPDFAA